MSLPCHSNNVLTPSVVGGVAVTHCSVGHSFSKKPMERAPGYPERLTRLGEGAVTFHLLEIIPFIHLPSVGQLSHLFDF